jgi:hypothetical protein
MIRRDPSNTPTEDNVCRPSILSSLYAPEELGIAPTALGKTTTARAHLLQLRQKDCTTDRSPHLKGTMGIRRIGQLMRLQNRNSDAAAFYHLEQTTSAIH